MISIFTTLNILFLHEIIHFNCKITINFNYLRLFLIKLLTMSHEIISIYFKIKSFNSKFTNNY